jgi:hypothetical protein
MSCEADFCNTTPTPDAPCDLASHCDLTCGFCSSDPNDQDGHRRLMKALSDHRRAQLSFDQCSVSTFAEETARVNEACCDLKDPNSEVCSGGTPSECDAKCAIVYNDFYSRCSRLLGAQLSLEEMGEWEGLYNTCTTSLPKEPLLRVLALCSTRVDPCDSTPCLNLGTCEASEDGASFSCTCSEGYTGPNCETEICAPSICLNGGTCEVHGDTFTCTCLSGFEGNNCGTTTEISPQCCSQSKCIPPCPTKYSILTMCLVFAPVVGHSDQTCHGDSDFVCCMGACRVVGPKTWCHDWNEKSVDSEATGRRSDAGTCGDGTFSFIEIKKEVGSPACDFTC